ncbi:LRR receptor-like serine threonine-protein kinase [Seminavis robusta]|uniref:LRR receptor-like serine threonine-protein kinase n=1 Tax=Seminavis robusta TaxID=568900 RepID=A0A9N8HR06_9STRA|nr:LRR receptor-like serine threonine-protein kinase [Seminavis robusta]|eukprot:Sro1508_g278440.1 LRR receptor-like serine threonine-protein kinase (755) ;mRNA; r:13091-15355
MTSQEFSPKPDADEKQREKAVPAVEAAGVQRALEAETALMTEKGAAVMRRTVSLAPPPPTTVAQANDQYQEAEAVLLEAKRASMRETVSIGIVPAGATEDDDETAVSVAATTTTQTTAGVTSGTTTIVSTATATTGTTTTTTDTGDVEEGGINTNHPTTTRMTLTTSAALAAVPPGLERSSLRASVPGAVAMAGIGGDDSSNHNIMDESSDETCRDVEQTGHSSTGGILDPLEEDLLVEARLVGADDSDVFEARTMEFQWRELATHPKVLAMLCVVVMVAVGVAVGVTRRSNSDSTDSDSPVWDVQDPFESNLPNNTLEAIRVPFSPQARANQWMLQDDTTNLTPQRQQQRFAMATFFYATNGEQWTLPSNHQWLNHSVHECHWGLYYDIDVKIEGIDYYEGSGTNGNFSTACPQNDGVVRVLVLAPINAVGTLPNELFQLLPELEVLDLSWNHGIHGTLPTYIGGMQKLGEAIFESTGLSGAIPSEVGLMPDLQLFSLHHCKIAQQMPTEIGSLSNLKQLFLEDNQITGPIPSELGLLSGLTTVELEANVLTGTLPAELFHNQSNLYKLSMGDNFFSGSIPPQINELPKVRVLVLQWSGLTGPLPDMSRLTRLTELRLGENEITGTLPSSLASMTNLDIIILDYTSLSGPIPSELGLLSRISEIWLQHTHLEGTLPSTLGQLQSLAALVFSNTPALTGIIPSEFGQLENMAEFWIDGTMITGSLPPELCELYNDGFLVDLRANCSLVECCSSY